MRDGIAHLVWFARLLAEAIMPDTPRLDAIRQIGGTAVTDAKSVYDALQSRSSPSGVQDKLCAVDLVIIRETARRANLTLRWAPSALQLADGLTKETPEAGDTLRGTLRQGFYQLASEESALKVRAMRSNQI